MFPIRMCCVCRNRHEKSQLIRVVKYNSEVKLDHDKKLPGRGAYICKSKDCIEAAQKRRAFERALSCKVDASFYEELKTAVNDYE